jgi:hypothetical protein
LQSTKTHSPQAIFKPEMKRAKEGLQNLTKRVNELPKTAGFDPLRQRLASIDSQYQATGQLLNSTSHASPEALLKLHGSLSGQTAALDVLHNDVVLFVAGLESEDSNDSRMSQVRSGACVLFNPRDDRDSVSFDE